MWRTSIRVKSLTLVMLLVAARTEAQEPAQPKGREARIKELQKERLETARELVKQRTARFRAGTALGEELLEATRTLMDAELDVCESNNERVAVLERILAVAKENEKLAKAFADTAQGQGTTLLAARAERLRIEIALERARAKTAPPK